MQQHAACTRRLWFHCQGVSAGAHASIALSPLLAAYHHRQHRTHVLRCVASAAVQAVHGILPARHVAGQPCMHRATYSASCCCVVSAYTQCGSNCVLWLSGVSWLQGIWLDSAVCTALATDAQSAPAHTCCLPWPMPSYQSGCVGHPVCKASAIAGAPS